MCLNPYSNGILTDQEVRSDMLANYGVLILILMEYSQTAKSYGSSANQLVVLILILMEYSQTSSSFGHEIMAVS